MAAFLISNPSRLTLVKTVGFTEGGKPVYKGKTYNNVKEDATHQDVYEVALALGDLGEHEIFRVERHESGSLNAL